MKEKKTILLVEDDYLDVMNFERNLAKLNLSHELFTAHNGKDALDMLTGNSSTKLPNLPDIIVLDINMPKMNGLEFLRIIRNYINLANIKVYVTTTSEEEYDKISAQNLGISGYLIKPVEFDRPKATKGDHPALKYDLLN